MPGRVWPLDCEQARTLLEAARGDWLEALYALAVTAGLRQGELLGLRWEDVDLQNGTLQVRRALTTTKDGPKFTAPKTPKSRRSITLTAGAVDAPQWHHNRQYKESAELEGLWQDYGLVFATRMGTPINRKRLHDCFKALLKSAKLPNIRFHDLRHTCATLLLSQNVNPKIVFEMLGHATIAITLDTYSHLLPSMSGHAAAAKEQIPE